MTLSLVALSISVLECQAQLVSLRELPAVLTLNHLVNKFYQDVGETLKPFSRKVY